MPTRGNLGEDLLKMIEHIKYDWISGEGAMVLLLPENVSHLWGGSFPPTDGTILNTRFRLTGETITGSDYGRAVDTYEYIKGSTAPYLLRPIQIESETGIIIHDDCPTAWLETESGALLLRSTFGEYEELELLEEMVKTSENWQKAFNITVYSDTFHLFDPAFRLEEVAESERLKVKLKPGEYTVCAFYEDTDNLEVIAHKLIRI